MYSVIADGFHCVPMPSAFRLPVQLVYSLFYLEIHYQWQVQYVLNCHPNCENGIFSHGNLRVFALVKLSQLEGIVTAWP
jgi:hypothetical protein